MKTVIKRPLVTEKNSILMQKGVYTFEVDLRSDKGEIKKALQSLFKVQIEEVRTVLCRGKGKATRWARVKPTYWKKAYVKLAAGEKIPLFGA